MKISLAWLNFSWLGRKIENALCEPGTTNLSWGRCGSTFCTICSAVWISIHFHLHGSLPDAEHIKSLTEYSLAPYGANKGATMITDVAKHIANRAAPDSADTK